MNGKQTRKTTSAAAMVEYIVGCKWSMQILTLINQGVDRPGAITRSVDGLTTKVQNDCLSKMVSFGILEKFSYPEVPPRVEYKLTIFGRRFIAILDAIAELQREIDVGCGSITTPMHPTVSRLSVEIEK
ncbi:helix-turn-helix transcriptional regulator [Kovacikia minuta CCNUW1]|uniref:winged helix-turn-helix transcriptional regulator n=1 Tax=Kovacikia minuta TaxID=2931930 RepID=UPI001CCF5A9D|nr:helix-turn-helix domain-containing protein [Kovacikia minuta]UBF27580.1 helix-turn-helix transcriptional regulator [Kovacikia minuta CCNUW1]